MPKPGEHKTVQTRILKYAGEIGWTFVSRKEAEERRGFDADGVTPQERARNASLYLDELLYQKVREFNPKYMESEGALIGDFRRLHANIRGNRDFLGYLRNSGKFLSAEEKRELDLKLIDYENHSINVFEVTEEFYWHNGHYGTREDVVFLINGIPVLVIECKNADKDEAVALGIDQIRRYHRETPEVFVPEQIYTATAAIGLSYGVTWNMVRRNIFNWKSEQVGQLEEKVKSFCAIPHILGLLKAHIVFAEKDEEQQKYILCQHQTAAVEAVIKRAHDPKKLRGLIWHTQGSGKTYTMIKAAELLFKAPESDKPTVLMLIDRNELVQSKIDSSYIIPTSDFIEISDTTIEFIKKKGGNDNTKVINLVKSIEKTAEEGSDDLYLIAMSERARAVQENYEDRQTTTQDALNELLRLIEANEKRKKEQAEKGLDGFTFFVYQTLLGAQIQNAEQVSRKIKDAFVNFPNWQKSINELREVRKKVTFAIFSQEDDIDKVTALVDDLFRLLTKAYDI
ncbi:MAG: type I restriction endonuclease subunit R [Deltaproteobacteria bacterium]|nr:type I restriction endonuclease subunit R [Deltaproteobacteria bacterium]